LSNEKQAIQHGERIAQIVVAHVEKATLIPVEIIDETERGEGGFGSTGVK
jgi:dUTP pyrophosphatase